MELAKQSEEHYHAYLETVQSQLDAEFSSDSSSSDSSISDDDTSDINTTGTSYIRTFFNDWSNLNEHVEYLKKVLGFF